MLNSRTRTALTAAATIATIAAAALAPVAGATGAAHAGQTVKLTAKHAYIDNKRPGCCFVGTVSRGDHFKIDRVSTVSHGSAKGRWFHGVATVHGDKRDPTFTITGWMKASDFR
jgi:hypothetical protein